jgi:hypothetical protein
MLGVDLFLSISFAILYTYIIETSAAFNSPRYSSAIYDS